MTGREAVLSGKRVFVDARSAREFGPTCVKRNRLLAPFTTTPCYTQKRAHVLATRCLRRRRVDLRDAGREIDHSGRGRQRDRASVGPMLAGGADGGGQLSSAGPEDDARGERY